MSILELENHFVMILVYPYTSIDKKLDSTYFILTYIMVWLANLKTKFIYEDKLYFEQIIFLLCTPEVSGQTAPRLHNALVQSCIDLVYLGFFKFEWYTYIIHKDYFALFSVETQHTLIQ